MDDGHQFAEVSIQRLQGQRWHVFSRLSGVEAFAKRVNNCVIVGGIFAGGVLAAANKTPLAVMASA